MSTFLTDSLNAYLNSLDRPLTNAETPHIAALKLMAKTLDAQDEPASSLLSAYARELARFQKGRAANPAPSKLQQALDALGDDDDETEHD